MRYGFCGVGGRLKREIIIPEESNASNPKPVESPSSTQKKNESNDQKIEKSSAKSNARRPCHLLFVVDGDDSSMCLSFNVEVRGKNRFVFLCDHDTKNSIVHPMT